MDSKAYLKRFFEEKEIPNVQYEIEDKNGFVHLFDNEVVIDRILNTSTQEQNQIANVIRKIDFQNGDINHFLKYMANALVLQWSKSAA